MKHVFIIALTMFALMFLSCCDDKDKVDDQTVECKCDSGVVCPDGSKEMCPKTEVSDKNKCDPACDADKQDCICEEDKCECKEKSTSCKCENGTDCPEGDKAKCVASEECKCNNGTDCPEGDKAKCEDSVSEDKCAGKSAGEECDTDKVCSVSADGKLFCDEKPAAPTNPCDGKNAGDVCDENKTCQAEADALVCKDTPVPSQPDKAE